jgi:hypothetical protein
MRDKFFRKFIIFGFQILVKMFVDVSQLRCNGGGLVKRNPITFGPLSGIEVSTLHEYLAMLS